VARRTQWWARRHDGAVTLRLLPDEAQLLVQVLGELRTMLEGSPDDPVMRRLFPTAYLDPTEEDREREYEVLAHASLLRTRLDSLAELLAVLEPVARGTKRVELVLADEQVGRWMGVLNDVRLALGVAVDITEDVDPDDYELDDPKRLGVEIYALLTWFFGELVELLLETVPEDGLD
jgi:Domain of unknown function (DUF2017)